ncbi:MAG: DUF502 domain-containing protein [Gammaproteobacteria bacterium]|nr:DUF502 domain-containing protein [Gammaproteobacteria bacterium]
MRKLPGFIKTTAIGGLLVIVPISIGLFVLAQLYIAIVSFVRGFVDALPGDLQNSAGLIFLLTLLTLIGFCFLTGLIVRTRLGVAVRRWAKRNIANRIPMYNALTSLTKRVVGVDGAQFAPIEVDLFGSDARLLGFLIEKLPDDRCAVYVPSAPLVTAGQVYLVPASRVTAMGAKMGDAMAVVSQWGVDARSLYTRSQPAS